MIGAGMVGIAVCVTKGDLVRSRPARYPAGKRSLKAYAENCAVHEESERLIVASTPVESREQRRGRSQEVDIRDI